jgi:hypothetical protein
MAGVFKKSSLTAQGIALLAKAQAGQCTIALTHAVAGSGSYTDDESIASRTELKEQRQKFPLNSLTTQNQQNVYVRFIMTNKQDEGNLETGYPVKEIGILATDPDEGEILYAIAIAETDQWDYMPAYDDLMPATITVDFLMEVSNAENVVIQYDPGQYALAADLSDLKKQQAEDTKALEDTLQNFSGIEQGDALADTDTLLIKTEDGSKQLPASVLAPAVIRILCGDSAGSHNALFRGKCLGNALTAEQSEAIRAGTFTDLFIGDYWTINDVNWRIAHFDYWYLCGDTSCDTHHAVIVPDTDLYTGAMNSSNTTTGGYVGSTMYKSGLDQAKTQANEAFGSDHILTHREYLTNAVSNGRPSAGAWYDSNVELMNENMVYGSHIFAPVSDGSTIPCNYTISRGQMMLFHFQPNFIHTRDYWCWLRDVVSGSCFAGVGNYGDAGYHYASGVYGVRPAFPIY